MRKVLTAVLALSVMGFWTASAEAARRTTTVELLSIKLDRQHISAESYYNGTSYSGGGIMACYATFQVTVKNRRGKIVEQYTYEENVSLDADWSSSNPNIYPVFSTDLNDALYDAPEGQEDGLWIYGGDSPNDGTTTVTVTYGGKTATGSITFWST